MLKAEVADLAEQLLVVKDERDVIRAHEEELVEKVAVREEELARAHRSYVDLAQKQDTLELEDETSNLLAEQLAQLSAQVRELQEARESAVKECGRLRGEATRLKTDNKALTSERDKLVRKKEKLEAKKAELVDKLTISEKARLAARERTISLLERKRPDASPATQQCMDTYDMASARSSQRSGVSQSASASTIKSTTPKLNLNSPGMPHFDRDGEGSYRGGVQLSPLESIPQSPAFGDAPTFGFRASDTTTPRMESMPALELKESKKKSKKDKDVKRDSSAPSLRFSKPQMPPMPAGFRPSTPVGMP